MRTDKITDTMQEQVAGDKGHQLALKATVQPTINICSYRAALHECKHTDNNAPSPMSEGIKMCRHHKKDGVEKCHKTVNRALFEINIKQCSLVLAAVIQLQKKSHREQEKVCVASSGIKICMFSSHDLQFGFEGQVDFRNIYDVLVCHLL